MISGTLDLSIYDVGISVADGTYSSNIILRPLVSGGGKVTITGNVATPANVSIVGSCGAAISGNGVGINYNLSSFKVSNSGGYGISLSNSALISSLLNVEFGACSADHIYLESGARIRSYEHKITGSAPYHISARDGSAFTMSSSVLTITGTPTFTHFYFVDMQARMTLFSVTYSGSTSDGKVSATALSVVNTYGLLNVPGTGSSSVSPNSVYA